MTVLGPTGKRATRSALTLADFGSGTVACTAGQFTQLGSYQLAAGEYFAFGYGVQDGMDSAQGRIYGKFQTSSPAEIKGTLRIRILSSQNKELADLGRWRTEVLNTSASDRRQQTPFPFREPFAQEDRKLVIEFDPDSTSTVSFSDSALQLDMTFDND